MCMICKFISRAPFSLKKTTRQQSTINTINNQTKNTPTNITNHLSFALTRSMNVEWYHTSK
jgi:galactose mutarotase-like enzyme